MNAVVKVKPTGTRSGYERKLAGRLSGKKSQKSEVHLIQNNINPAPVT
jgi:hypothetical protein